MIKYKCNNTKLIVLNLKYDLLRNRYIILSATIKTHIVSDKSKLIIIIKNDNMQFNIVNLWRLRFIFCIKLFIMLTATSMIIGAVATLGITCSSGVINKDKANKIATVIFTTYPLPLALSATKLSK